MKSDIKISIILPIYNVEAYLPQCLDSLCQQSLKEIEIILVDDGSTDDSMMILQDYEKKDHRIRIFQNKIEGPGAAEARNTGLKQAQGEYVLLLDSDDYFDLSLAEKTYQKAVETGAEIVIFDAVKFDTSSGEMIPTNQFLNYGLLPEKDVFSAKEVAEKLFTITDSVAWNKLYKRSFLQQYSFYFQAVHVIDDAFFTFSVLSLAEKITVLKEDLLFYRVNNPLSQISNRDRDPLTPIKVGSLLKQWLEEHGLFSLYEKTYYQRVIMMIHVYFDTMTLEENFKILYDQLHSGSLQDLSLLQAGERGYIQGSVKKWMEEVCRDDFEVYVQNKRDKEAEIIQKGTTCVLYGCGIRGDLVYEAMERNGGICLYAVDSSMERQGQVYRGMTIQPPTILNPKEVDKVLVSTLVYFDVIRDYLVSLGFDQRQIAFV